MSERVYGIDLGTTYSAIAYINDFNQAEVLKNFDEAQTTASVVYFEADSEAVVGAEAKKVQLTDPDNSCSLIKRHMGTEYPQEFRGQMYTPEKISALILKALVKTADSELGEEVHKVVITVPAYFGVKEKEATKQAGQIAGLEVVGIVTEPVAAALSLGIRGEQPETILVYDLGGGTFDATVMRVEAGKVDVVAIDGMERLGGADWDAALAQLIADKFVAQAGLGDENPRDDAEFEVELLGDAETTKKSLTVRESATVRCRYEDKDEQIVVTRSEFEEATRHLVADTIKVSKRIVETAQAKIPGLTVDRVLLVGGSSKMPMIDSALREQLGWTPVKSDFDLAVAKGAAIYGQAAIEEILSTDGSEVQVSDDAKEQYFLGGSKTLSVTNVLSRGLGVRFQKRAGDGAYIGFLVEANATLPATPSPVPAKTTSDGGPVIALYEQGGERLAPDEEDNAPEDHRLLQEKQLPVPSLPKGSPINVTLTVTAEGLARVNAEDPSSGQSVEVEAQISVLSKEEVAQAAEEVSGISLRT